EAHRLEEGALRSGRIPGVEGRQTQVHEPRGPARRAGRDLLELLLGLRVLELLHHRRTPVVGADHVVEAGLSRRGPTVVGPRAPEGGRDGEEHRRRNPSTRGLSHAPLLRTLPAGCGWKDPARTTRRPLIRTSSIPAACRRGSVKVERSATAPGSKTT